MEHSFFQIDRILNLEQWQPLQDALSDVLGLAIITVNYKGVPITEHSGCQEFCRRVRENPELSKRCQKCDSRGGLEAVRSGEPYIYLCHYHIIDIAIPISIDDKYIGAVMAGQVRLSNMQKADDLEQIVDSPTSIAFLERSKELQALYLQIPAYSYEDVKRMAGMLHLLSNYIVDEAKGKNYILDMYKRVFPAAQSQYFQNTEAVSETAQIHSIKEALTNAITDTYLSSDQVIYSSKNRSLQPAFDYIFLNKNKAVSLDECAKLCHLSTSYFGRSFTKEVGENFTSFVSGLKVSWAKQLLEKTDLPVAQISEDLGFNEPGYFIKMFKKSEHITPGLYRKYCKERTSITGFLDSSDNYKISKK